MAEREEKISALINEGKAALRVRAFDKARSMFQSILELDPEHQEAKKLMAFTEKVSDFQAQGGAKKGTDTVEPGGFKILKRRGRRR